MTLALVLFGCSSSDNSDSQPTAAPTAADDQATAAPTAAATEVPTQAPTEPPEPTEEATEVPVEPELYTAAGPHPVGVMLLELGEQRFAEVWYPVEADAVAGQETEQYDSGSAIPEAFRVLIPEEMQALIETNSYRDAPPALGDRPVVVYSHGFGGHRNVAIFHTSHLASWGFVVASVEHNHRNLIAQSTGQAVSDPEADQADIADTLVAIDAALPGAADTSRVGVVGHSAGGYTAIGALANDSVQAVVALASGGMVPPQAGGKPTLVIAGELDTTVPPETSVALYEELPGPRTYVSLQGAGHNSFTDSCVQILSLGGLSVLEPLLGAAQVERAEDGCTPDFSDPLAQQAAFNHMVTSHFMQTILGTDAELTAEFADQIEGVDLVDFRQSN